MALSPSSRGLGHQPFTLVTRVRIPLGTPSCFSSFFWRQTGKMSGGLAVVCSPANRVIPLCRLALARPVTPTDVACSPRPHLRQRVRAAPPAPAGRADRGPSGAAGPRFGRRWDAGQGAVRTLPRPGSVRAVTAPRRAVASPGKQEGAATAAPPMPTATGRPLPDGPAVPPRSCHPWRVRRSMAAPKPDPPGADALLTGCPRTARPRHGRRTAPDRCPPRRHRRGAPSPGGPHHSRSPSA